jgi:hypothetical protein
VGLNAFAIEEIFNARREVPVAEFEDAVVRLAVHAHVLSIPLIGKENDLIPDLGE